MENLALNRQPAFDSEISCTAQPQFENACKRSPGYDRDIFCEIMNSELEAQAAKAMASNSFGDYRRVATNSFSGAVTLVAISF